MKVIKETTSLVLALRNPGLVTSVVPRSRVVNHNGMDWTQVYFGLDEARVLRNLGIDAPSPIRYFYDFPVRPPWKPLDHQVTTAEFFTLNNRGICLNDMGTMKTLSSLWAADYLMAQGQVKKCCIVTTKSTMSSVWEAHIQEHFMGRRTCAVLNGTRDRRTKRLAEDVDFYIINHDGIKVMEKDLAARNDINLWLLDEAADFRTTTSERHKTMARLVRPTDWFWLMTGTPCPQDPTDAWGLAKLMHGARVQPAFFSRFREDTMVQIGPYKWVPKPDAYEKAYAILQPSIRFTKEMCISLPPLTFQTHMASLSPDQVAAYKSMVTHMVAELRGTEIKAANAAVKMAKLLQVCVGSVYDEFGEGYTLDSTDRLKTCEQICEQAAHKVLVFVPVTHALDKVAAHLAKRWSVAKVDGRTSDGQRKKIFSDFQEADHPRIIVAHPQTTAHGLTLTKADTTIWYAPITRLDIFDQANARTHRPGQKNATTVAMIAATVLEQNLYQALKGKQDVQNSVLAMFKAELGFN